MQRLLPAGFAAFVVLISVLPEILSAQRLECDDCKGWPWTFASATITADRSLCTFGVDYRYRASACDHYDIEIIGIRNWNVACSNPFDPGAMVSRALEFLLRENPMGFPPFENGQCDARVRTYVTQCMGLVGPGDYLAACADVACCVRTYSVCRLADGTRQVRQTGGTDPGPAVCQAGGANCFPVCEEAK